jgi:uncharacterized membrane protein YkvI
MRTKVDAINRICVGFCKELKLPKTFDYKIQVEVCMYIGILTESVGAEKLVAYCYPPLKVFVQKHNLLADVCP